MSQQCVSRTLLICPYIFGLHLDRLTCPKDKVGHHVIILENDDWLLVLFIPIMPLSLFFLITFVSCFFKSNINLMWKNKISHQCPYIANLSLSFWSPLG